MAILLTKIFAGFPKTVGEKDAENPMDREWTSAIFKEPVHGPVWVGESGLSGDGQADQKNHGGPEKAVFGYSVDNYTDWQNELGNSGLTSGAMGENFALANIAEDQICIGDTYQIGEAMVQVSQPRQPCWKPARRFKIKNLALSIQNTGRTGWYFRVVKEGMVEEGQVFKLLHRPYPQWTIERCNQIIHAQAPNFAEMKELALCELLAPILRDKLTVRVEKQEAPNIQKRVFGPNGA